jgi:hypothetical protein
VGTAALVIYLGDIASSPGGSVGTPDYASQGENSIRVHLVVSADGRLPRTSGGAEDLANFYEADHRATRSIITVIFREIVVN